MELTVTGRRISVTDRLRRHLEEKLEKIPQLAPRVTRTDVVVSHETNPRLSKASEVVEITCHEKRHIVRAEAAADDIYAAIDLAMARLLERLRRHADRRSSARQGGKSPEGLSDLTPAYLDLPIRPLPADEEPTPPGELAALSEDDRLDALLGVSGNSPIQVRTKVHVSNPMDLSDALTHMEMLGHDFFLFHDRETGQPSVVYRRRGWSYGVIHLDVQEAVPGDEEDAANGVADETVASA